MYHTMTPERAADRFAEDWAAEDLRDQQRKADWEHVIDEALDDFAEGIETPPMDYEFVEAQMIDDMRLFHLIKDAWRTNDYSTLGEDIRQELLLAADRQADAYRR